MPSQEFRPVEVYGKPGCVQCKFTVKELEKLDVPYNYIDISVNVVAEERIKNMGFTTLPVVLAGDAKWAGLKVDNIRRLRNG